MTEASTDFCFGKSTDNQSLVNLVLHQVITRNGNTTFSRPSSEGHTPAVLGEVSDSVWNLRSSPWEQGL